MFQPHHCRASESTQRDCSPRPTKGIKRNHHHELLAVGGRRAVRFARVHDQFEWQLPFPRANITKPIILQWCRAFLCNKTRSKTHWEPNQSEWLTRGIHGHQHHGLLAVGHSGGVGFAHEDGQPADGGAGPRGPPLLPVHPQLPCPVPHHGSRFAWCAPMYNSRII